MRLFKNVDIINLEKILNEGILSLEESGNDNWEDGYRAEINDSSVFNFFRGEREDRTMLDLYNIVYEFQERELTQGSDC